MTATSAIAAKSQTVAPATATVTHTVTSSTTATAASSAPIPDGVITNAEKSIMSISCQDANSQTQFEGTAFMVAGPTGASAMSGNGRAVTASHVVSACGAGSTVTAFGPVNVSVLQNDVTHDLALLSVSGELEPPLPVESAQPHVGEQVALIGEANQQSEVTQGVITAVGVPQTLAGEASTETLSDSIQVQTSSIAGESGGPAIDAAGNVVGIIEGGNQTGGSAVLTPVSDLPANATQEPSQPPPTTSTTTTAPSVAALPNQCDQNISATSDVSCRVAENTFYEYWKATGGNPGGQINAQAWSPTDQQYYPESCSSTNGVVDCLYGNGSDVRFSENAVAAYTQSEASGYAAAADLGPNG